jgi:hypothetical protein
VTAINLNVSADTPDHARWTAWDWPELTDDAVTIWRGTADDPRRDVIMVLDGADPDECADWLEALSYALRRKVLQREPHAAERACGQKAKTGRSLEV